MRETCAYRDCKNTYHPSRHDQCSSRCREAYRYDIRRASKGPKQARKRHLGPIAGSAENGRFYSAKTGPCKRPLPPEIGGIMRKQIIARQHLENPLTIFLPDGSQGRLWLATGKDGSKLIGDERHWRLNTQAAIEAVETAMIFIEAPIVVTNFNPHGPTRGALQGDGYQLAYDAFGYHELSSCLDRRPRPSLAKAA